MTALPSKFVGRVLREMGESEGRALCEALDSPESPTAVRRNPFKDGFPFDGEPIGWSRDGMLLASRPSFTNDPAFHAGCYYVQEAASQFVGHILAATGIGGGRILDMCAAPGGKTTLYSSIVGPDGLVVANEPVRNRAAVLADNVRKWGAGNTVVTCNEPRAFVQLGEWFDVVAVDAPCSGEGMFRKDDKSRSEWSENIVKMCAARQRDILDSAWQVLRPGGVLIYSTCTFNRTENEEQLCGFAAGHEGELAEAEMVECRGEWGIVAGREGVFQTFRFYPHRTAGEGFFTAVARKSGSSPGAMAQERRPQAKRGRAALTEVGESLRRELNRWFSDPEAMRFAQTGDDIYAYRRERFDDVRMLAERLSVICSGVETGRLFGGRLKPEHGLAMFCGLNRNAVPMATLDRSQALGYLRKEPTDIGPFSDGMNLVVCEGCALGFAKRIGNRYNNLYPNSLRILKG